MATKTIKSPIQFVRALPSPRGQHSKHITEIGEPQNERIRKKRKDINTQTKHSHPTVSVQTRHEKLVEPLEWKAPDNRLKPSSIEPPKLELKELPEHLEYTFLQEDNQLPVVISSALSTDEKTKLLEVLRNHKGAIAWIIADIKGIDLSFCTYKILMEDKFKPSVQPQTRVNPNIKEVVKKEVHKTP
ncbi:hypothetical protein Tco_0764079 [Tanacetum coccineum]